MQSDREEAKFGLEEDAWRAGRERETRVGDSVAPRKTAGPVNVIHRCIQYSSCGTRKCLRPDTTFRHGLSTTRTPACGHDDDDVSTTHQSTVSLNVTHLKRSDYGQRDVRVILSSLLTSSLEFGHQPRVKLQQSVLNFEELHGRQAVQLGLIEQDRQFPIEGDVGG